MQAQLTLTAQHGGAGAALLEAPLTYQWGEGHAQLPASFADLGLADFAGAVTFTRTIDIDDIRGQWVLDLGVVRGTAEVIVNGQSVGARIWSPYQFDISERLVIGQNQIAILVTNTLAPYLAGHSPTHYTPAHQEVSGIFGPLLLKQYHV
jgi:beta-galactosidase/beta-glucuronidase